MIFCRASADHFLVQREILNKQIKNKAAKVTRIVANPESAGLSWLNANREGVQDCLRERNFETLNFSEGYIVLTATLYKKSNNRFEVAVKPPQSKDLTKCLRKAISTLARKTKALRAVNVTLEYEIQATRNDSKFGPE